MDFNLFFRRQHEPDFLHLGAPEQIFEIWSLKFEVILVVFVIHCISTGYWY